MATATKSLLPLGLVLALGFAPPVLAKPDLCVLAPQVSPIGTGARDLPLALVPLRRPTLFLREPLAEIRLEEGDSLRWRASTRPDAPLEGPLTWPLDPLTPGQRLTLRLRPLGAGPNQFASLLLQAGPHERLTAGDNLLRSLLAGPPTAWRPAIEGLLARGDRALATALLFASEGPSEPDLNALRLQAAHTSCP